jgi:hypothetical protein
MRNGLDRPNHVEPVIHFQPFGIHPQELNVGAITHR